MRGASVWAASGCALVTIVASLVLLARSVEASGEVGESMSSAPAAAASGPMASGYQGSLGDAGARCCVASSGACEPAERDCSSERIVVWCDSDEVAEPRVTGIWECVQPGVQPSEHALSTSP